ncbi:fibrinogen-like protein 1 [Culex quinquefasciatus]|uniref:fibrinogen-like protein 1 n=1 Tax=Culex quinquefasciatus TaxID=7176 RepID=UPI0018E38252|nr:fibrinogen-like protein 1 [Culex quinquefasciatus]
MRPYRELWLGLSILSVLNSSCCSTTFEDKLKEFEERISAQFNQLSEQIKSIKEQQIILREELSKNTGAYYASCRAVPSNSSNLHMIRPRGGITLPFIAYCNQRSSLGSGGWIVIHRRYNGQLDFERSWQEYKEGFGEPDEEHWLGLKKIHGITRSGEHELLVELRDFDGTGKYALYDGFGVSDERTNFTLSLGRMSRGTAGDSMRVSDGMQFSTPDRDNDRDGNKSCAEFYRSGWWFNFCMEANLNGLYKQQDDQHQTMNWYRFRKDYQGLKEATMMIREKLDVN